MTAMAALALAALVSVFWPFVADDAFITFRYSANLAAGYGPIYNQGQFPIEGYTTFLWMVLMAVPHLLRLDVVTFSKIVGALSSVGFAIVAGLFVYSSVPFLKGAARTFPATFAALLLACYGPTAIHSVGGMETTFFAFLMTLFLYVATLFTGEPSSRRAGILALSALLLGLTRPEGNLVVIVVLVASLVMVPQPGKSMLSRAAGALYVLPAAVYFAWRCLYYMNPFPLSFYIKVGIYGTWQLRGAGDVVKFLVHFGPLFWILAIIGMFGLRARHIPAVLGVLSLIVFYLFPDHILGFDYRFLFPSVPFLFSLAAVGVGTILRLESRFPETAAFRRALIGVGVLALCLIVAWGALPSKMKIAEKHNFAWGMHQAHIQLGMHLAKFPHDEEGPILAISDAGAVPYYSGWRTIDTYGLNEPHIAIFGEHDPEYVLGQDPDLLVVLSKRADVFDPRVEFEGPLYDAAIGRGMVVVLVLEFFDSYYLWCLAYPESEVAGYLR
jgi:hypothetical protein